MCFIAVIYGGPLLYAIALGWEHCCQLSIRFMCIMTLFGPQFSDI